jgi:surfactin family lipopeptide synthetase C
MAQRESSLDVALRGPELYTHTEIEDSYIMTPTQQGMLFHTLHTPRPGMYVRQMIYSLHERLNVDALQQAWQQVIDRHPNLRTSVRWEGLDEPVQQVHRKVDVNIEQGDWRGFRPEQQRARLEEYLHYERSSGFDLASPPLFRLRLFRLGDHLYQLVYTFHHVLSDGFSDVLVSREVFAFYDSFCNGSSLDLQEPVAFRRHADWIRSQDFSKTEPFWRDRLSGINIPTPLPATPLPSRSSSGDRGWARKSIRIPADITNTLREVGKENGLTLSTFVHAVWALLLSRYCGEEDVLFGAIRGCRRSALDGAGASSVVGPVINTLPMRVRVAMQADVLSWLKEVRAQWVALAPYEHTPVVEIQRLADLPQGAPLFESIVSYDRKLMHTALGELGGAWATRELRTVQAGTNYPLTLAAYGEDSLLLDFHYQPDRFEESAIDQMLIHVERLFIEIANGTGKKVWELNLVSGAEREQLLEKWNGAANVYDEDACIHELFQQRVREKPGAVALECEDQKLSYEEMNSRANQLAHYLREKGIGNEAIIGVCLPRGTDAVIAMLGILKAGGAYLPLDASYPCERLRYMLRDAQARLVITQHELSGLVSEGSWSSVLLDMEHEEICRRKKEDLAIEVEPENLAYIIYTSGSTGVSKGVAVCHRGVVRLVRGVDYVKLDEDEVLLQSSPLTFDASTFEIWGALLNGARCVVMGQRVPAARDIGKAIREKNVSTLWLTSSLYNAVIDEAPEELTGIKQLLIGGEALSVEHVLRGRNKLDATTMINGYGPTESTTFACSYRIGPQGRNYGASIPIGRAINHTEVYILDGRMDLVPAGILGEIYIGGDGLARCYLGKPDLTAERFVPNPFSRKAGARLYRTGDIARYLPDGFIEFLGRKDNQVKIRGHRIELEEVESALERCPGVSQAAVVAQDYLSGGKRLIAYIVADQARPSEISDINTYLRESLPEYMIPSPILKIDKMPLTHNGKIDRRALPGVEEIKAVSRLEATPPRTATEQILAGIWSEVLQVNHIGVDENFFELGGHSLLAMQVNNKLRQAFDVNIPLSWFFESPTIAALAGLLEELATPDS